MLGLSALLLTGVPTWRDCLTYSQVLLAVCLVVSHPCFTYGQGSFRSTGRHCLGASTATHILMAWFPSVASETTTRMSLSALLPT